MSYNLHTYGSRQKRDDSPAHTAAARRCNAKPQLHRQRAAIVRQPKQHTVFRKGKLLALVRRSTARQAKALLKTVDSMGI